jgi:hypothetical protein
MEPTCAGTELRQGGELTEDERASSGANAPRPRKGTPQSSGTGQGSISAQKFAV